MRPITKYGLSVFIFAASSNKFLHCTVLASEVELRLSLHSNNKYEKIMFENTV